jgi:hypothetical protein
MMTTTTRLFPVALVTAAVLALAAPAGAQSVGVRAGASVDPDQFYFGGHLETPALVDRVHLRPNVEIGVGDDVTLVAVNVEAVYKYPLRRSPWTVYGGGGPAINYYNFENDRSDTEAGFNFVGGLEHERGLFFEVKVGAANSPDLKFGIGYSFGR